MGVELSLTSPIHPLMRRTAAWHRGICLLGSCTCWLEPHWDTRTRWRPLLQSHLRAAYCSSLQGVGCRGQNGSCYNSAHTLHFSQEPLAPLLETALHSAHPPSYEARYFAPVTRSLKLPSIHTSASAKASTCSPYPWLSFICSFIHSLDHSFIHPLTDQIKPF